MSFVNCINGNKSLTAGQKKTLINGYDELFQTYRATMGDDVAAAAAASKYYNIQASITAKKNENIARDVLAWQNRVQPKLDAAAAKYEKDKAEAGRLGFLWGGNSYAGAVRGMLEDAMTRRNSIEMGFMRAVGDLIEDYRSKHGGITQDIEGFRDIVRDVISGNKSTPEAKALSDLFDLIRRTYEAEGGIIGKIDNYFPQSHNAQLVGRVTVDAWKATIKPMLDRQKMIDPDTGMPFTDAKLDEVLNETYESIRTNGLDDVARRAKDGKSTPGARGSGAAVRHSSGRFLHFKDADSFFAYNDQFGYGDAGLFDAMIGHISVMSRDIALMQEFGPKPETMFDRMMMNVKAGGNNIQTQKTIQGMYDVLSGRTSATGELGPIFRALSDIKNVIRSSLLGSAAVSAMSDSFYVAFTAKMNGLPQMDVMGQYFKLLNPANASDRAMARRQTFIASAASGASIRQSRHIEDVSGNGWSTWMANATHRLGGLGVMTDSAQQATALSAQGFFAGAKDMNMKWDDVPDAMKEALARWDMNEADFNNIIAAQKWIDPDSQADFIRSEDVMLVNPGTARKYDMWMTDMAMSASNEPRLLAQAISTGAVLGEARQGSALRMTASSVMMFKSFGVTVMMNHMLPALRHMGTAQGMDKFSMIAPILLWTTLLGGMVIQTRDVVNGKTPREMNTPAFWSAAMMQGGGFGIFGDFLFSDMSRFGNDLTKTLAGPMVGFGSDLFKVFKGNFDKALDSDQESKFLSDLFQFSERYVPVVKLWYTRLLLERMMLDQAERAIDPNFDNRMRRIENRARDEKGQEYWWAAGDFLPGG